jgi:hypothetical protein
MLNVTFCDKASFRLTHAYPPIWRHAFSPGMAVYAAHERQFCRPDDEPL